MSRHNPRHRRRYGVHRRPVISRAGTNRPVPELGNEQQGLVIANHGRAVVVEDSDGAAHRCVAGRRVNRAVTGDQVEWQRVGPDEGRVTRVLPRRSLLERMDERGGTRPIAANVDQIVVVVATRPALQENLIDRYLVVAEYSGIRPVIVLNKTDLLTPRELKDTHQRLFVYKKLGYALSLASAASVGGLEDFVTQLHDSTSILVGQSGVGKSSLVTRLLPNLKIAVGELNEIKRLGRHTTTVTTLYHLPAGGHIIDSPGVRNFGLWHIPREHLAQCFVEFRKHLGHCRFRDCGHDQEPGCALRAAVDGGHVDRLRFEGYHALMRGLSG